MDGQKVEGKIGYGWRVEVRGMDGWICKIEEWMGAVCSSRCIVSEE